MRNDGSPSSYRYQAFVSYSHSADNRLAPAVRNALHRFAKPWYRLRAMRVFRDESGLAVTPALWPSIQAALLDAEYFLLLASPDAAASEWVQREVECWLEHRPADHLLIALTEGEIEWDDAGRDFDWSRTGALPRCLAKAFAAEPKYIDLRWARTANDLSLRNPDFLAAVASIASTVQGRPLDELVGEDIRQHRRTRRLAGGAIFALATFAIAALTFAVIASQQRDVARRQERIAVEQQHIATEQRDQARRRLVQLNSANGSRAADTGDIAGALLWFAEALRLEDAHPIEQGLLRTRLASLASRHPRLSHAWSAARPVSGVKFTRDGAWVVAYPRDEEGVLAWDAQSGATAFAPLPRPVADAAMTEQGKRLLTFGRDGAQLWDAQTGQQVLSVAADTSLSWAGFAPDVQRILTHGDDRTLRVWDAGDGREIAALEDVAAWLDTAFDGDGVILIIRNHQGEIVLWSNRTGERVVFDDRHAEAAELSADRRYVLLFDDDSSASVWDAKTGRQLSTLGDWQWVDHARLSPDGQRVAMVSRGGWAIVWDIAADREIRTVHHAGAVLDAAFSPDGKWLATASTDQQAHVWNIETGKEVVPPLWHETTVSRLAFNPDGQRLATTTADDVIRVWDLAAAPRISLPHDEFVRLASFDASGNMVLTATNFTAQLWKATGNSEKALHLWRPGAQIYHAAFRGDGAYVLTASEDHAARLWDTRTGREVAVLPHPRRVTYAAFNRDGTLLLTASGEMAAVWNVGALPDVAREPQVSLTHDEPVVYGEFSADGRQILTVGFGGVARMWNVASGQERPELHRANVTLARLSPDGTRLATAEEDRALRIWGTANGAQIAQTIPHEYRLTALAFSPDGRHVVTASEGSVRVWDAESGRALAPPMQHGSRVLRAVFSPDGTRVVTASQDRTARVWNATSGQPVTEPLEHGGVVRDATFSPDGKRVVTASEDRTAALWDVSQGSLSPQAWMERAQLVAARRIDDTGAVVTIDAASFLDLWKRTDAVTAPRP